MAPCGGVCPGVVSGASTYRPTRIPQRPVWLTNRLRSVNVPAARPTYLGTRYLLVIHSTVGTPEIESRLVRHGLLSPIYNLGVRDVLLDALDPFVEAGVNRTVYYCS